jgi:spore coat protein U-like protein
MRCWGLLCLAGLLGLPVAKAWSQTCGVAATGLAFGSYQPLSGLPSASTATITVTCNPGLISLLVSYTIQIGAGTGGSFAARSMGGTSTRLGYQLYRDVLDTQIWGDGTAGTFSVTDGYLLGILLPIVKNYTGFGNIPASQRVTIGAYTDILPILLSY